MYWLNKSNFTVDLLFEIYAHYRWAIVSTVSCILYLVSCCRKCNYQFAATLSSIIPLPYVAYSKSIRIRRTGCDSDIDADIIRSIDILTLAYNRFTYLVSIYNNLRPKRIASKPHTLAPTNHHKQKKKQKHCKFVDSYNKVAVERQVQNRFAGECRPQAGRRGQEDRDPEDGLQGQGQAEGGLDGQCETSAGWRRHQGMWPTPFVTFHPTPTGDFMFEFDPEMRTSVHT